MTAPKRTAATTGRKAAKEISRGCLGRLSTSEAKTARCAEPFACAPDTPK